MRRTRSASLAVLLMLAGGVAHADPASNWTLQVIPYGWLLGLHGDITIRNTDVHVDKSFWDLLDNLDMGAEVYVEGWWRRKWGFLVDPSYFKATTDVDRGPANAQVQSWVLLTDVAGLFRPTEWALGQTENCKVWIDVKAGIRHVFAKGELDLSRGPQFGQSRNWVDPIFGGRVGFQLSEPLTIQLGGDVGGFHVGSNFTWSVVGALEYRLTHLVAIVIAYRALAFDSETGSDVDRFKYDVTMHGPVIGVSFQF